MVVIWSSNLIFICAGAHIGLACDIHGCGIECGVVLWWGLKKMGVYQAQPGLADVRFQVDAALVWAMSAWLIWMVPGHAAVVCLGLQNKVWEMNCWVVAGSGVFSPLPWLPTGMA